MGCWLKLFLSCFSVRHKAKEILELIQNDERLRDERKKAKKNKDKYKGMSGESAPRFGYSKSYGTKTVRKKLKIKTKILLRYCK